MLSPQDDAPTGEPQAPAWHQLPPAADLALRLVGGAVALALAAALALIAVGLCPVYVSSVRLPATVLLAVIGNPALVWFTYTVTGNRRFTLAPALVWCTIWFVAATGTAEGDLLVWSTNWVAVATTLAGPTAFGLAIYRLVLGTWRFPAAPPKP